MTRFSRHYNVSMPPFTKEDRILINGLYELPDLWPRSSLDLNLVDYQIWGLIQERVYKTPVRDTNDLKQGLIDTWASIPQNVVDKAVD